jgi:hypothetical protein
MCTLSVVRAPFVEAPGDLRWRVMFNRDERITRGEARLPQACSHGRLTGLYPVDPDGGGTWIAATSAGLVFALLNETGACSQGFSLAESVAQDFSPAESVAQGFSPAVNSRPEGLRYLSRGLVVPQLLASRSLDEAAFRLGQLPTGRFRPFRLLVVGDAGVLEAVDAGDRRWRLHEPEPTFARTSSSRAPVWTTRRRLALFARLVPTPSPSAQDAYHHHQWPANPGASVLMRRPGAATVSLTTIEAFASGFRVSYRPSPAGAPDVTELPRAA